MELVKASCIASKCSGQCSCKAQNLEPCKWTCNNVAISQDPSDDEENEDLDD